MAEQDMDAAECGKVHQGAKVDGHNPSHTGQHQHKQHQQGAPSGTQQQRRQHKALWRLWHIWLTAALVGFCLGRSWAVTHSTAQAPTSAECMHALGGGRVGIQGTFPHMLPKYCLQQQAAYAAGGDYMQEVNATAISALVAFGLVKPVGGVSQQPAALATAAAAAAAAGSGTTALSGVAPSSSPYPKPSPSAVFIFDIDETALSNFRAAAPLEASSTSPRTTHPSDPVSHPPADAHSIAAAKAAHQLDANAPPLLPVRELYLSLRAAGYAVAFVTGRGETGRTATLKNLVAAGYGQPCTGDGSDIAPPAAEGAGIRDCHAALMMRPHGDTRLASVYKPAARAALEAAGYSIIGSIGDQFSDLSGTSAGDYSFKLPNVWYYIL